jgi:hypothetical protein
MDIAAGRVQNRESAGVGNDASIELSNAAVVATVETDTGAFTYLEVFQYSLSWFVSNAFAVNATANETPARRNLKFIVCSFPYLNTAGHTSLNPL